METGFTPTPAGGLNENGIPHQTVLEYRQKEMRGTVGTKPTRGETENAQAEGQSNGQQIDQADVENEDEEMIAEDESLFVSQSPHTPAGILSQPSPTRLKKEAGEIVNAHGHNSSVPASGSPHPRGFGMGITALPQTPHKNVGLSYATPPATMDTPENSDFSR